jgi:di/tricarboxylate transporter
MTEATFVFGLILMAAALMASNRVRYDIVALLVLLALMLSGVLTVSEALAGFGSSVVIMVAGLLIVGEMLARTGVAAAVGDWILNKGGSNESRLLVLIMIAAGFLGAFMSSTAVVAVFIPIVLRVAEVTGNNASRMLLPMSYAALISGMLTLIATAPNIVVNEELKLNGADGFGFFGFTAVGLCVLAVAIVYILLAGRFLLPDMSQDATQSTRKRSIFDVWGDFRTDEEFQRFRIGNSSCLVGQVMSQTTLFEDYGVHLIGLARLDSSRKIAAAAAADKVLAAGDILLIVGSPGDLQRVAEEMDLVGLPREPSIMKRWLWELGGATLLIHPDSKLQGKTVRQAEFRQRYGVHVLGMRRGANAAAEFADIRLQPADSLFIVGPWSRIRELSSRLHDFVLMETPAELAEIVPSYTRMRTSLAILVAMVLLTVFEIVPLVAAVLMAVLAAVFTRCLTMEDAYRSINLSSLILIAGMLPLADALDATGGTKLIVESLMNALGDAGPYMALTLVFFLTAALGLVLSNTASAVLVAPIAIYMAESLGVSPYPLAVAVVVAASAAYSTPVSTPVVTLVVEPGRYRFTDFVKVGVPLLLLSYVVTIAVAPLVFPFSSQ